MKIADWLHKSTTQLSAAKIPTARLDCLVLLADLLDQDKAYALSHPDTELTPSQLAQLDKQLKQREKHAPLAYIRGKTEFYGRNFAITVDVLEPRPESETMIELLKSLPLPNTIIDIGTGSGALAITAKLELPSAEVMATDIDPSCLAVARKNADTHKVEMSFYQGDLLNALTPQAPAPDIILANLPYVPTGHALNEAAMNEPRLAIFGGEDGLDLYRTLFRQLQSWPAEKTTILTESLPYQHEELQKIAQQSGFFQDNEDDFIQVFVRSA